MCKKCGDEKHIAGQGQESKGKGGSKKAHHKKMSIHNVLKMAQEK
jgi:hypothetical protein